MEGLEWGAGSVLCVAKDHIILRPEEEKLLFVMYVERNGGLLCILRLKITNVNFKNKVYFAFSIIVFLSIVFLSKEERTLFLVAIEDTRRALRALLRVELSRD